MFFFPRTIPRGEGNLLPLPAPHVQPLQLVSGYATGPNGGVVAAE